MPSLVYDSGTDWIIGDGYKTRSFNIPGDPSGALIDGNVRYRLFIERDGGGTVDLSQVNVYMRTPDGERQTLYNQIWNAPGRDDDEDRDSDSARDHDISFHGDDAVSTESGFNNNGINGTWKLEVDNDSGFNLRLKYLTVWIDNYDFPPAPDLTVSDLRFTGNPTVGEIMTVEADITNLGDKGVPLTEWIDASLYINGQFIETSTIFTGLGAGDTKQENFSFRLTEGGLVSAEVRVENVPGDSNVSNNSRTETFTPKAPDLVVDAIRLTGDPTVGEFMTVEADIKNIGNGDSSFEFITAELYVGGEFIETSTIFTGLNAGQTKQENFSFLLETAGEQTVEVRVENIDDESNGANNSLTTTFTPKQGDLTISDVRYTGDPTVGEWMTIEADVTNIGTGGISWENILLELLINGEFQENSIILGGLGAGNTKQENFSFRVDQPGTTAVEIRVERVDAESDVTNNDYVGEFTPAATEVVTTLNGKGAEITLAAHIVNAVYGDGDLPYEFRGADHDDNGLDDNYKGYFESLFNRSLFEDGSYLVGDMPVWKVMTDVELGSHFTTSDFTRFNSGGLYEGSIDTQDFDAQALLTKGVDADGDTTLVIGLRGTDDVASALGNGEAFTGLGQANYYKMLMPLINAAISYANDDTNGIDKLVVAGHSLAGAMVDLFTAISAPDVDADVELHAIAIASAGLDADVLDYFPSHDTSVITDLPFIYDMNAPDFYIGLSHTEDSVTFPEANFIGQNIVLFTQQRFIDGLHAIDLPNVENSDYPDLLSFRAEHSSSLYAASLRGLGRDPLLDFHDGHKLVIGNDMELPATGAPHNPVTGEAPRPQIDDLDGLPLGTFDAYEGAGPDDSGTRAISGTSGDEFILGLAGDDDLRAMGGNDLVSGGSGNDQMFGGDGNDRMDGGWGQDEMFGGDGNDIMRGGLGNDELNGGLGADDLFGDAGDDTLYGGWGNDALDGGDGVDAASFAYAPGRVVVSLEAGTADIDSGAQTDTLVRIENIIGSNFNDRITGDAGDNHLIGGLGDDVINGRGGADLIEGEAGRDTLSGDGDADEIHGGTEDDTLLGLGGADLLFGDEGDDRIEAGLGNDSAAGGQGDDLIFGNFGWDMLAGGAGNDALRGGGARDTLLGDAGNDHLVGGNGIDVLNGGAGNDVLTGGNGDAQGDTVRDVFVFTRSDNGGGGYDRVRDFEDTIDKLDLTDLGYASFADLLTDASQSGAHLDITLMGAGIVRLENFQLSDFGAGDVLL